MMNLVIRFISKEKKICHRLGDLSMLNASLKGNEFISPYTCMGLATVG
jgi:hypothetical protein